MNKFFLRAYSVILLIYTGFRTYDFISSQLPKTDANFWLSIAFLFGTEIGLVFWHETNLKHTTTAIQDNVTFIMVWVDFIGSLAAGIADMILRQTFAEGYTIPPFLRDFLMYGLPLIMGLNVAMAIIFEQNDAKTQEAKAEKALQFEIHQEAMQDLRMDREAIAQEKKSAIYSKMRANVTGRIDGRYGKPTTYPIVRQPQQKGLSWLDRLLGRGGAVAQFNQESRAADQATRDLARPTSNDEPEPILHPNGNDGKLDPTNQRRD